MVGSIQIPPAGSVGDSIFGSASPLVEPPATRRCSRSTPTAARTTSRRATASSGQAHFASGRLGRSRSWGGEDTNSRTASTSLTQRIAFVKSATIVHPAARTLAQFSRVVFIRGRAKCQFARKVPISGFVGNRIASYGEILRAHSRDAQARAHRALALASILLQQAGFATSGVPGAAAETTSSPGDESEGASEV